MDVYVSKSKNLRVRHPYDKRFVDVIKRIPGRSWNSITREWEVPVTSIEELKKEMVSSGFLDPSSAQQMSEAVERLFDYRTTDISHVEKAMTVPLRLYQKEALRFFLHRGSSLGALPFGSGKTGTSLSYLYEMLRRNEIKKALVLVPKNAMWHWKNETEKFFGDKISVLVVPQEKREDGTHRSRTRLERERMWKSDKHQVFVANYDLLRDLFSVEEHSTPGGRTRRSIHMETGFVSSWGPGVPYAIIADEVTRIKGHNAQRTKFLRALPSKYRIGLSGRPLENRLEELYSIMDWIWPGCLGSFVTFRTKHIVEDKFHRPIKYMDVDNLRRKLKWLTIAYRPEDVLPELPPLISVDLQVDLSPEEMDEYARIRSRLIQSIQEFETSASRTAKGTVTMLAWTTMARMYCDHPVLVANSTSKTAKLLDVKWNRSSKLESFMEFLEDIEGKKAVIFTQFKKMQDIIVEEIQKKFPLIRVYVLCGKLKDPQKVIDDFRNDNSGGILVSTDSGAQAIELQTASILINYDSNFNPAIMEQRTARVRRIGQKNPVHLVNVVCVDHSLIEHRVRELIDSKNILYKDVMSSVLDEDPNLDVNGG